MVILNYPVVPGGFLSFSGGGVTVHVETEQLEVDKYAYAERDEKVRYGRVHNEKKSADKFRYEIDKNIPERQKRDKKDRGRVEGGDYRKDYQGNLSKLKSSHETANYCVETE